MYLSTTCNHSSLEIRIVILDISKAFEKVLRYGLLFKLKQNGFSRNLFKLIIFFFEWWVSNCCSQCQT